MDTCTVEQKFSAEEMKAMKSKLLVREGQVVKEGVDCIHESDLKQHCTSIRFIGPSDQMLMNMLPFRLTVHLDGLGGIIKVEYS